MNVSGNIIVNLVDALNKAGFRGTVSENTPLAPHTTWRVGGPAALFVEVPTIDDLRTFINIHSVCEIPLLVIGAGSNLLVSDDGYDGVVVHLTGEFSSLKFDGTTVHAGAAVSITKLVAGGTVQELKGIERLAGIPGTLGGAIVMNAGTYDEYIGDLIKIVYILMGDGRIKQLTQSECGFDYRTSRFQGSDEIILRCTLQFEKGDRDFITSEIERRLDRRKSTQPINLPSCGSVFRNPPGEKRAAELIEKAGLKGKQIGGAAISDLHANFIVNKGDARATDILSLMALARRTVREKNGITLKPEVRACGFNSTLEEMLDAWTD